MIEHVPTCMSKKLIQYFKRVVEIYSQGSMIVHIVLMDIDFSKTIEDLMNDAVVNNTAAKEHVSDNERTIHKVK